MLILYKAPGLIPSMEEEEEKGEGGERNAPILSPFLSYFEQFNEDHWTAAESQV